MNSKKGTIQLYIYVTVLALIVLIFVAVLAPSGVLINTEFTRATNEIRTRYMPEIDKIQNDTIRSSIKESLNLAVDNSENMVEVNSFFYKWGWLFVILIPLVALFLYSRMQVETNTGNNGGIYP